MPWLALKLPSSLVPCLPRRSTREPFGCKHSRLAGRPVHAGTSTAIAKLSGYQGPLFPLTLANGSTFQEGFVRGTERQPRFGPDNLLVRPTIVETMSWPKTETDERSGEGAMSDAREERFCALYESTRPRIIAYALRRTSSREDAADVVAETFEIAWRRVDDVPAGQAGLLWLYVTARYVVANHGRRARRRDETMTRLAEELRGVPLRTEASHEESLVMQSSLASLSPDERELLMLAGWEGLSAAEIGRVLGCSPVAARIRLHRARVRLKSTMTDLVPLEKRAATYGHEQGNGVERNDTPEEVLEP